MNLLGSQKQHTSVRSAVLTNAMQNKINILTINNNKLVADRQKLINIINNLQQQVTKLNVPMLTIEEESINLRRFQHIEAEPPVSVSTIEEGPQVSISIIEEEPQVSVSIIEAESSENHSLNLTRFQHIELEQQVSNIEEESLNLSRFQHFNIL